MGFLVRVHSQDADKTDEAELERAAANVADRYPHFINGMRELKRVETRRWFRERGIPWGAFPTEMYVVTFPVELADVPRRYGEKLGRALYYMHTGRAVPPAGGVSVTAMSNADFMSPKFPIEKFNILSTRPVLTRSKKSLEDQFAYRYAVPEEGGGAAFLVQFRLSTAAVILVYEDEADYRARVSARRDK